MQTGFELSFATLTFYFYFGHLETPEMLRFIVHCKFDREPFVCFNLTVHPNILTSGISQLRDVPCAQSP